MDIWDMERFHQNRLANRIEGFHDYAMAAETACEADGREPKLGVEMQNRVTCIAGERIWKGDRVYCPPHGSRGQVFRVYGVLGPCNELGEALEDAEAGGLCVVARDDGNVPMRRGRTLTQNLEED